MRLDAETSGEPEDGAGVLGDIRFEQGDRHRGGAGGPGNAGCVERVCVPTSVIPWSKPLSTASLPGLRSGGKGANKPPTIAPHHLDR